MLVNQRLPVQISKVRGRCVGLLHRISGPKSRTVELGFLCIALAVSLQPILMEDIRGPFINMISARRKVANTVHLINMAADLPAAILMGFLTDFAGQRTVWILSVSAHICGVILLNLFDHESAWTIGASLIGVGGIGLLNAALPVIRRFGSIRILTLGLLFAAWKLASVLVPYSFVYAQQVVGTSVSKLVLIYVTGVLLPMLAIGSIAVPSRTATKNFRSLGDILNSSFSNSQFVATLCFHYLAFIRLAIFSETHQMYFVREEFNAAESLERLGVISQALCGIPGLLWASIADMFGMNGLAIGLWGANTCAVLMWAACLINKFEMKVLSLLLRMYQGSYTWMSLYTYLALTNQHDYFCTIGSLSFLVPGLCAFLNIPSPILWENEVVLIGFMVLFLSVTLYIPPSYLMSFPAGCGYWRRGVQTADQIDSKAD